MWQRSRIAVIRRLSTASSSPMQTLHRIDELRVQLRAWRMAGERIAFVPTMGNLHAGHSSLIEAARSHADRVVASIFVNKAQFGLNEDFDQYPRTLEADQRELEARGADLLFAPDTGEMYPDGLPNTTVTVGTLTNILCGKYRPGHFDGVSTVVSILFNIVQPDVAVFGSKDYQQLQVIERMVHDLRLPVQIVAAPIVRDADGLAMSSRNQYLSAVQRAQAAGLYACLQQAAAAIRADFANHETICASAQEALRNQGFNPQYFELHGAGLEPATEGGPWVLLAAAMLGRTRLIDNIEFSR